MLKLSYRLTPKLTVLLNQIDRNRVKILSIPLSRETEVRLTWTAKLSRTFSDLQLEGDEITRSELSNILSSVTGQPAIVKEEVKDAIAYYKAQDYINYIWYMNSKDVSPIDVYELYKLSSEQVKGDSIKNFNKNNKSITGLLDYLNKGDDHPVIRSGIAYIQLEAISPFVRNNNMVASLLSQLYLYKNAYDMRGMLAMSEFWHKDEKRKTLEIEAAKKGLGITSWLEYYATAVDIQSNKIINTLRADRKVVGVSPSFWKLNKRQKQILSILENPIAIIKNEDVQKKFKISQVTASRDLSKLYKLGFVFRRGEGRSVYYTRV